MKDDAHAVGPTTGKRPATGEIHQLQNDIALYRSHIKDLRSEILSVEQDRNRAALELISTDEPAREDSRSWEDLGEHVQSMVEEIRQYEAAIRGAQEKIEILTTHHYEHLIREELKRRQAWIRHRVAERTESLRHHLSRGGDRLMLAQHQDELDNVEALAAREYDNLIAPERTMDVSKGGHPHNVNGINSDGDVVLDRVKIPGSAYNQIRARIEQEMNNGT
jgi:chromosome segregation ATPase